jgi:hypothetical protein
MFIRQLILTSLERPGESRAEAWHCLSITSHRSGLIFRGDQKEIIRFLGLLAQTSFQVAII